VSEYKQFLMSLGSAVQKGLFYKYSHPETKKTIELCFSHIDRIFQEKKRIVLLFNQDSVFVNFEMVKINQHMGDFMFKFLSERSYSGFLLEKTLSFMEFSTFLQILNDSKGKSFDDTDAALKSYNITHAKILFYQPSMGGRGGTGTGNGNGTGNGSGTGGGTVSRDNIYDPSTGAGSFVILSGDIRERLLADYANDGPPTKSGETEQHDAAPEKTSRAVTADLSDEEIAAVISEGMSMQAIENNHSLIPWDRLNSLEKTLRLGTLAALPDGLESLDAASLYHDVADLKKNEALDNILWMYKFNAGDSRENIKRMLIENARNLNRNLHYKDFPSIEKINEILFDDFLSGTEPYSGPCVNEYKLFAADMIEYFSESSDFQLLKTLFSKIFDTGFVDRYSKTEFFSLINIIIEKLKLKSSSPDRFLLEDILLICGDLALTLLPQALMEEKDKDVRRLLINVLIKSGDRAIPFLKRMLRDKRWYVIRNGIKILGEISTVGSDILIPLIDYPDPRIRLELVSAFRNMEEKGSSKLIVEVIKRETDPDNILIMLNDFNANADNQGFNALYLYLLQNYKNASLYGVSESIANELVLYARKHTDMNAKLVEILNWEHSSTFLKEDIVLKFKQSLLSSARKGHPELYDRLLEEIRTSDNKNIKKLRRQP